VSETSPPKDVHTIARAVPVLESLGTVASTFRLFVVLASAGAFFSCLTQVAFFYGLTDGAPGSRSESALELLLSGWITLPFAFFFLLINPLTWATGVLYYEKWKKAALATGFAAVSLICFYDRGAGGITTWLANPAIGFSWVYYCRGGVGKSLISAAVALILMLNFLRVDRVPFGVKLDNVAILSYGTGYWLWVASAAIMVLATGSHLLVTSFRK
jgi:hypothetical protein